MLVYEVNGVEYCGCMVDLRTIVGVQPRPDSASVGFSETVSRKANSLPYLEATWTGRPEDFHSDHMEEGT